MIETGIMSLYSAVLAAIFVATVVTFAFLLVLDAPYGRFLRRGWGVALSARWAWFIMEFPAAFSIGAMAVTGAVREASHDPVAWLFLALWELHYLYRSIIYPTLLRGSRERNMPISLIAIAIAYNTANGYVNGYHLFHHGTRYGIGWLADPRFLVGTALFAAGAVLHLVSDRTLRRLRPAGSAAVREYRIPNGGMFRFVSCPNYLGEIIEWCGFAVATWSIAGLSFALFTVANLLPRALSNHRWYRKTFEEYPPDRKALIPLVL